MSDLNSIPGIRLNEREYTLQEVFAHLKAGNRLDGLLRSAVKELVLFQAIAEAGLAVREEELQKGADDFRTAMGLQKVADTETWLKQRDWTLEDFEEVVERRLLKNKLVEQITQGKIENYFLQHRHEFDQAEIAHLVVDEEALASELLSQLEEEEENFATLVSRFSTDESTKQSGGLLGVFGRSQLVSAIREAVFQGEEGQVVGPVQTAKGYHLVRIDRFHRGELTPEVRANIREKLFDDWLREQLQSQTVEVPLLEQLRQTKSGIITNKEERIRISIS